MQVVTPAFAPEIGSQCPDSTAFVQRQQGTLESLTITQEDTRLAYFVVLDQDEMAPSPHVDVMSGS